MDKIVLLITALILMFAGGFYTGSIMIDPEIKEIKTIEYKTKWKVKTADISFKDAVGHINSEIVIDHTIEDNWVKITAHDTSKETKKDILVACKTQDWTVRIAIGASCLAAGMLLMLIK